MKPIYEWKGNEDLKKNKIKDWLNVPKRSTKIKKTQNNQICK